MADYAIGDVQGCYDVLQRLLNLIDFNDKKDKLWFVGDLVNRGKQSLEVLRFIKNLPIKPCITLGNHDLHLLGRIFTNSIKKRHDDTLYEILTAEDVFEIGHWLRNQSILIVDESLNVSMSHAGIFPKFNLKTAKILAKELETVLSSDDYLDFLNNMYGNQPDNWSDDLTGIDRLRFICNSFTRMRMCDIHCALNMNYNGTIEKAPVDLYPWFAAPNRVEIKSHIVFGHWAALMGKTNSSYVHAIDTGCLWGGFLTAIRLQDWQRFSVKGVSI